MPKTRIATLALGAALLASSPAAHALDLGASIGGVEVGVSVGGESGVGVDIDLGGSGSGGSGVDIGIGSGSDGAGATPGEPVVRPLGQEGALQAVKANRALPLEDIMTRARLVAEGEIIDAQLMQVRSILVYEIKVLGRSGDVSKLYFYARSGALVAPR
jgi:hypothetical protein